MPRPKPYSPAVATIPQADNTLVTFPDAYFDGFGRIPVANPVALFDGQLTYDLQPLLFEQITAESGATVAHDTTNRNALMTFSSTPTGGKAIMQTWEWFHYQPGKAQQIFITFKTGAGAANVEKFAGYSDGNNGIEFVVTAATNSFRILSDTTNGDETVTQANWNIDRLDGTGPSGITLDVTKDQILAIDLQALYEGRVRCGFDIDGHLIWCHEFLHANKVSNPYIQNASLPIRVGMTSTGTASTTMKFTCCSVMSSGGQEEAYSYPFSVEGTATAGSGADTHIISIQPKTTFNSIANRSKIVLESIDVVVTGSNPVLWKACIGQALTSTSLADVNATYSGVQTITGTLSGTPAIVFAQGYVAATNQTKQAINKPTSVKYPITLNAAGAARDLGRITILVQGIGGTSATRVVLNWKEIR